MGLYYIPKYKNVRDIMYNEMCDIFKNNELDSPTIYDTNVDKPQLIAKYLELNNGNWGLNHAAMYSDYLSSVCAFIFDTLNHVSVQGPADGTNRYYINEKALKAILFSKLNIPFIIDTNPHNLHILNDLGFWFLNLEFYSDNVEESVYDSIKFLKELKENLKNPLSQEGIKELEELLEIVSYGDYLDQIKTNFTIVRGLAYYDGFCVETNLNFKTTNNKGKEVDIGSICSGGQYNKLISRFKGVDIPGTGMSFGVDRLLFAMMQLDQIEVDEKKPVIICVMDEKYLKNYYEILKVLRDNNINSEIFLDSKKNLGKQLTYANKKQCPVAVICGENEFKDNTITLKNLLGVKGENNQVTFPKENLINEIKKFI